MSTTIELEYPEVISELEDKSKGVELLVALDDLGGRATLTRIKGWADWETHHVDYRQDICEEHYLITVGKLNEGQPGKVEREFVLNERGEAVLDEWREVHGEPDTVNEDEVVELTRGELREMRAMKDDLEWLEGYVMEWTETGETYLLGLRRLAETAHDEGTVKQYMDAAADDIESNANKVCESTE